MRPLEPAATINMADGWRFAVLENQFWVMHNEKVMLGLGDDGHVWGQKGTLLR